MVEQSWHVLAMGGGGFSMSEDGLVSGLDRYVMELSGVAVPKICFVGTASGDSRRYIAKFHQAFADEACETTHLELFRRDDSDGLACVGADFAALAEQDVVYVGGGSTANLLALWRLHGLDRMLLSERRPRVLCGISAGALCWFAGGLTDSFGPDLQPLPDGLGLLAGSMCPHYDGEAQRRPAYRAAVAGGVLPDGLAVEDHAAVHFTDGRFVGAVCERDSAGAYAIHRTPDGVVEDPLQTRRLLR